MRVVNIYNCDTKRFARYSSHFGTRIMSEITGIIAVYGDIPSPFLPKAGEFEQILPIFSSQ